MAWKWLITRKLKVNLGTIMYLEVFQEENHWCVGAKFLTDAQEGIRVLEEFETEELAKKFVNAITAEK